MKEQLTSAHRSVGDGKPIPVTTYRVQLGVGRTLDDVAADVAHVAALGATHLYLSPVLQAAPGSTHGYDVVDHSAVSRELGGLPALQRLATAAHAVGLGIILDVVPNHMAVPTPAWHNAQLWSVLSHGPDSPFAHWFDVDWSAGDGALLVPVLGDRIGTVIAAGQITLVPVEESTSPRLPDDGLDGVTHLLRYFEHEFPVRPGTESLPLTELLDRQHYRLAYWRVADEELNYRRFFDVETLAAIRVEDPDVFDASHALILRLMAEGIVDGLRIDHPDGLADPAGYLARLRERTDGAWVSVEKILAGEEELPPDWDTVGTTGYEALWRIQQSFVDPGGAATLSSVMHRFTGDSFGGLPHVTEQAKRDVIDGALYAEVHRLTDIAARICARDLRLRDHTWRSLQDCIVELLVAFDRYRAYVVPGQPAPADSVTVVEAAAAIARRRLDPERSSTMDLIVDLLLGREVGSAGRTHSALRAELIVRFQQTCGAVTAKGVEDTAFYRWTHLTSLCEVGGEPGRFAVAPTELFTWAARQQVAAPWGMTTLSTHDTKRSEDVRARLDVISELPQEWAALAMDLRAASAPYRSALVDGHAEYLLWQTLVGTWDATGPISGDRLTSYLVKALREAKLRTTWTATDPAYETAVLDLATRAMADPEIIRLVTAWEQRTRTGVRAATLGTKLVQLCLPGVADIYQGTEVTSLALVDPDNRRPVDTPAISELLGRLDDGATPRTLDEEKLWVTACAARTRRRLTAAFTGESSGFVPLAHSSGHALSFARTANNRAEIAVVATRMAIALDRLGGWGDHTVALPEGEWVDALTGVEHTGGVKAVAPILDRLPVALLVRPEQA